MKARVLLLLLSIKYVNPKLIFTTIYLFYHIICVEIFLLTSSTFGVKSKLPKTNASIALATQVSLGLGGVGVEVVAEKLTSNVYVAQ